MDGLVFGTFPAAPLAGASLVGDRPSTSTPLTDQASARVIQPGTASVDEVMAEPERGNALADPVITGADSHNTASGIPNQALLLPPTGWTELQQVRVLLA